MDEGKILKLVQIGAGNIGRSFIGQIFSRAGWEVVFVDVDPRMVELLNGARFYTVVIKREGEPGERRRIGPVRAVNGLDTEAVIGELASADMAATSVGKGALPKVLPLLARGIGERARLYPGRPLDIIIAENVRDAAELFRAAIGEALAPLAGLVETSIGKMVPIMRKEDLAADPLQLFAEEYETLIVDRLGFRGPLPDLAAIHPVKDIAAYVDRKLFIHNLGHAAAAYLGFRANPSTALLAEALALPGVEAGVRAAMNEAAAALALAYPQAYGETELTGHVEDLIGRFKNRALGDTVHRVGRDLPRKLSRDDRLTGAMLLCAEQGLPCTAIAAVFRTALDFAAPGEEGALFPADARFREQYLSGGANPAALERLLTEVCGLDQTRPGDRPIFKALLG